MFSLFLSMDKRLHLEAILKKREKGLNKCFHRLPGQETNTWKPSSQNAQREQSQLSLTQALEMNINSCFLMNLIWELICPLSVFHRNSMTSATGWYKILLTFSPTMPTLSDKLCLKRRKTRFLMFF